MSIADRKNLSIRSILRNRHYQQDSGLYQRLEKALNKLPADDLSDLNMLISQKELERSEAVRDETKKVVAAGVICRCDDPGVNTCPAHGKK